MEAASVASFLVALRDITERKRAEESARQLRSPLSHAARLITSQLPVAKWHQVIGEPTFADAILDRIVHNAHRLELDGPSTRKIRADKISPATIDQTEEK